MPRAETLPWFSVVIGIIGVALWAMMLKHPFTKESVPHIALGLMAALVCTIATRRAGVLPALIAEVVLLLAAVAAAMLLRPPYALQGWDLPRLSQRAISYGAYVAVPVGTICLAMLESRRTEWPSPGVQFMTYAFVAIASRPFAWVLGIVAYIMMGGSWP